MRPNILTVVLTISILLLAACQLNNDDSLEGQSKNSNSPLPLSTTENLDEPLQNDREKETGYYSPGFGVPQEEPAKQPYVKPNTASEHDQSVEAGNFHLPFQDFQERWNAVSQEQGSNLQISALNKLNSGDGPYYQCLLNSQLELRVFTKNQFVQRTQLLNRSTSNTDLLDMLTGWSHIVMMFNPDIQFYQVDELFHDLGVGPNLDLNQVKEKTILFSGIQYTVKPINSGFLFQAAYPDN